MKNTFLRLFKRETANGQYIAFVDGIRFVAVFLVIIFHLQHLFDAVSLDPITVWLLKPIYQHGFRGVDLFFVLSGFMLGFNHLNYFAKNGKNQLISTFYKRRFLRIYPPFFIAMSLIFVGNVYLIPQYTFSELLPSYATTIFYINTLVSHYYEMPVLSNVTWTLEIEIQFYLLFPLLLSHLLNLSEKVRPWILAGLVIIFSIINKVYPSEIVSILRYLPLFLAGMLFSDLYFRKQLEININQLAVNILSLLILNLILIPDYNFFAESGTILVYPFLILAFFVFVSKSNLMASSTGICVIGSMCYTIYLTHTSVIQLTERICDFLQTNNLMHYFFTLLAISISSIVFYLIVEKPFMAKRIN